jgi:hypothetical protein
MKFEITERQQSEIQSALGSLEMIYNFHDKIEDHNEIMWKAVQKIAGALAIVVCIVSGGYLLFEA